VFDIHGLVGGNELRGNAPPTYTPNDGEAQFSLTGDDDEDKLFQTATVDQRSLSDTPHFSSTLKHSIDKKDVGTIRKLLKLGEDPLAQDGDGWCALHYAARTHSEEVIHILISSDKSQAAVESIDKRNKTGATPLHFAASIGNLAMVKELLQAGADKDAGDNHGRSPLFMAAEGNHQQVVEVLLGHGAVAEPYTPKRLKEIQIALRFRRRKSQGK
jgi:ankyrin repeat protein